MCNAWNHPPGCTCGWGGEGQLGGGGGWPGGYTPGINSSSYREGIIISYPWESSDFCGPSRCPKCGADVFFIRHNGGSVWVDELGWPWPKHGCFDDSSSTGYRFIASLLVRYREVEDKPELGRVIKRIYLNLDRRCFDHLYLIETPVGRLYGLAASRFERRVFTDLVAIRSTNDRVFLEDIRGFQVRVRNFRLTEAAIRHYLKMPDTPDEKRERQRESRTDELVWSIQKQMFIRKS